MSDRLCICPICYGDYFYKEGDIARCHVCNSLYVEKKKTLKRLKDYLAVGVIDGDDYYKMKKQAEYNFLVALHERKGKRYV